MALSRGQYNELLARYVAASNASATGQIGDAVTDRADAEMSSILSRVDREGSTAQRDRFSNAAIAATTGANAPRSSTTEYAGVDSARVQALSRARAGVARATAPRVASSASGGSTGSS